MNVDVTLAIGDRSATSFALAFAITQLVEVPIHVAALATAGPRPRSTRAAIAFGASALTHPIVWFAMPALAMTAYSAVVVAFFRGAGLPLLGRTLVYGALAEAFAVLAEALYLRAFGVRRALAWSTAANLASVIVGTLIVRWV